MAAASGPQPAEPALDELLDRLERLVAALADQAAPLERLVADYEEAQRLVGLAQQRLDAAAQRARE